MTSFENTEIAFQSKSNSQLKRAYLLFKIISFPIIVKIGKILTPIALKLHLPIKGLIKSTIFSQFCGGESISECSSTINNLGKYGVGTILDYSVEGQESLEEVEQQIEKDLDGEVLLFLNYLECIEIKVNLVHYSIKN